MLEVFNCDCDTQFALDTDTMEDDEEISCPRCGDVVEEEREDEEEPSRPNPRRRPNPRSHR